MRQSKVKIKNFVISNYTYLLVMLIATILLIIAMIVSDISPFGNNFPLPGNGFLQDYPLFMNKMRGIKQGHFFDFLDYGVGLTFDNYNQASFTLLRPWLFILYFLPKALIIPVIFIIYYFNYVITGPIFIYYLTHRKTGMVMDKKDARLVVFGLCYCLSAFTVGYFIYFFRFMIYAPLVFLGVEKIIYENKPRFYIISMAYFMATDAYYAFILCIFTALYFLVCNFGGIKKWIYNSLRFAAASVVSACLAAAFLIPYYIRTRYSAYGEGDVVFPSLFKWFGSLLSPLSEFRVAREAMTTSSVEYRTNIYCGIFILLIAPIYLMIRNISLGTRIKMALLLLVIYLGFDNQLINYVFHGFHYQWQSPNRFAAFFIFILLVMAYDVVIRLESLEKRSIIVGVGASSFVLMFSYITNIGNADLIDSSVKNYLFSFLFTGIYLILFILFIKKIISGKMINIFYIIASLEICFSSLFTIKTLFFNGGVEDEIRYIDNYETLIERHEDMSEPYIVTERPGETFNQNIAYVTGAHSLSFFSSGSYRQHFDLFYRWGMLFSENITYYTTGSPLTDMMLHVKYHTVNSDKYETISPYIPIDQEDNIVLYENPFYLPLGVVIDSSILDEWNRKAESYTNYDGAFDRDNAFSAAFGTGDIYDSIDISRIYSEEELGDEGNYYMVEEDSEGNALYTFYLNRDVGGAIYMQIAQASEYIGEAIDGEAGVLYYYVPQTINLHEYDDVKLARWNVSNFTALYNQLSQNTMTDQHYSDDTIGGKVIMPKSGMLYLAMPNIPGFKAYVDGKETEIKSYMDGIGLQLSPGEHRIELSYIPDGVVIGWQITIITALIMLIAYMLKLKKKA